MKLLQFTHHSIVTLADEVINRSASSEHAELIFTANTDHLRMLESNSEFAQAYAAASIVTADGIPVYTRARLAGQNVHHIPGSDLLVVLCNHPRASNKRFAFMCSSAGTALALEKVLIQKGFLKKRLLFIVPEFGFESTASGASASILRALRSFAPTHLVMGVGAPKSEVWTFKHRHELAGIWCCCFGAGVDYFAGTKRRAPLPVRRARLEWLWRLLAEPSRLAPRYAVGASFLVKSFFKRGSG